MIWSSIWPDFLSYPLCNIWGCVFSVYPFPFWWLREYTLCLIIIIKSEVWTTIHCLGLGHETMVCAVCLSIFLPLYVFEDLWSWNFANNLCPIHSPGLKAPQITIKVFYIKDAYTHEDIRTEMVYQRSHGHWWRWCWNFIHGSEKSNNLWHRTENKTWLPRSMCFVPDEVFRAIGKIYQVDEFDTNNVHILYVKKLSTNNYISQGVKHLFRLWDYHARSTSVSPYTYRNGYWEGKMLKMGFWIFPMYSQLCWITYISWPLHRKKSSCTILLIRILYSL